DLGIAALHLDAPNVVKFQEDAGVFDVVENRTRHALGRIEQSWTAEEVAVALKEGTNDPRRPYAAEHSTIQAFGGGDDPLLPYGSNDPLRPYDDGSSGLAGCAIASYLAGRRDEIEGILSRFGGSNSADGGGVLPSIATSEDITWSLRRLGIPSEN